MLRKLPEYYRFNIEITAYEKFPNDPGVSFLGLDNKALPEYKQKLTPGQWLRAKKYLTRRLIPFCGYTYKAKDEFNTTQIIKIT